MIITQRKRHRLIWMVMAVLLPILFILAIVWLPQEVYQEDLPQVEEKIDVQSIKVQ